MSRIICFGDSITYGESDCENGGWVALLKKYYLNKQQSASFQETLVYNLAIAGETADGLERRFKNEIIQRVTSKVNTTVFLGYGSNDMVRIVDKKNNEKNRVPVEYFIQKLKSCVEYSRAKKHQVVINNIIPFDMQWDGFENVYGDMRLADDIQVYNNAIEELCESHDCQLNNLFDLFNSYLNDDLLSKDGLHPNQKGHQLIFEQSLELLKPNQ